jgi:hypothetical protein
MENVMAQETDLQAGFDTLTQTLTAVADDVKAKIAEIVALETQLAEIQSTTSVDLSAAIAQAVAIRESLEGTAAAASGAAAGVDAGSGSTTTADQTGGATGTDASSGTTTGDRPARRWATQAAAMPRQRRALTLAPVWLRQTAARRLTPRPKLSDTG